ncbi:glycosyltransferase family 2 protein [Weissella confusa]|uniref:glycosyltransferase family 2 protein n=1 Tax=Weissella confusa TaxID=1583 RepID=UPI002E22DCF1|nr:glycosyltransferase family 2 protein [Weissella confusa]
MANLISVVVPVFNEEETIGIYLNEMSKIEEEMTGVQFEYWFVDDGSSDNTLRVLHSEQENDQERVHFISFSRNFGKEAALMAGLSRATGDYVVVMDVDLQDPPELLPEMYDGVRGGELDAVGTRRENREGEPRLRSWFSSMFYRLINMISDTEIVEGTRDYRIMNRQMVDAILSTKEYNRFSKGIFVWVGFKQKYISYRNTARSAGKTSWSFGSLLKYSIEGIVDFSTAPLTAVAVMGMMSFVLSIIGAVFIVVRAIFDTNSSVSGWPSLVVILLFLGGIQLLSIGVVGRYLAGVFLEVKQRPLYLVREEK